MELEKLEESYPYFTYRVNGFTGDIIIRWEGLPDNVEEQIRRIYEAKGRGD